MSLKYSFTFLVLSLALIIVAISAWENVGWFGSAFFYAAFSFVLLAVAYGGAGPGLLLKRASGRRSIWAWALLGPYFLLSGFSFALYRLLSREPAYAQAAPNVYFGRRLSSRESRSIEWLGVLDLAAEFSEARPLRKLTGYRSMPVLDATAPTEEQLRSAVDWIATTAADGPVYTHCALGHGRSACVVIAYLLSQGVVASVEDGMVLLRSMRVGVRLHSCQRCQLRFFEPEAKKAADQGHE